MATSLLVISVTAIALLFILYTFLSFRLGGHILGITKLDGLIALPFGILNLVVLYFTALSGNAWVVYIVFLGLYLAELLLITKRKLSQVLFVSLAYLLHFMALRAICSSVISMASGLSFYNIFRGDSYRILCVVVMLALMCAAIVMVLKFIPVEKIRIINEHNDQLWFMLAWLVVFCAYLLLTSGVYGMTETLTILNVIQLLSCVAILIGLYIVLLFSFRISSLLGYEQTNKVLRADLKKEKQYREAIISDSLATYEFNLSGNKIIAGFDHYKESLGESLVGSYAEMLDFLAGRLVLYEDVPSFLNFVSVGNLFKTLSQKKSELALEYRRLDSEGKYIWVRAITDLARDETTGEVRGFTYIKDIDKEKRTQLDLKHRAERDSLTGLYNKGMTAKLVNERLKINNKNFNALLIVDIDDFKSVNDKYGHAYGDDVLCDLAGRMVLNFRKNDIIGRVGGDEFVAFMPNTGSLDIVKLKATELCDSMRDNIESLSFSISVGIAVSPANGKTFDELYKNADTALYTSKKSGKDGYTIYK